MFKKAVVRIIKTNPPAFLLLCYALYATLGWSILALPICQMGSVPFFDNLFTAISAMSTTGLVTVDIGKEYSLFGQIVILLLIQLGGIGFMTFNTLIILAITNQLSRFSQRIAAIEFPRPKDFMIKEFISHVIIFTLACELLGAIALCWTFNHLGVENFIWNGIFHSISAFCTAGFSLFSDSMMGFQHQAGLNSIIAALCLLGAIGFITWLNFYKRITKARNYLSFTAKVILFVTFWFITLSTLIFMITETGSKDNTLLTSFFQVINASTTAGFNSLDIGSLQTTTIILLLLLMAIGASPSGTGGGLKTTTFVALIGLVKSTLKGESQVSFWKREISSKRLQLATATFTYYIFVLIISLFFLVSMENKPLVPLLFEAASAIGTIGLSMGITSQLTDGGKALISLLMLMGKVGILTFGIAITTKIKTKIEYKKDNELLF